MNKFQELQEEHQRLLEALEAGREAESLEPEVQAYVQRVRSQASAVGSSRDRDLLRANLRFWASYLYDASGVYPDTTLHPPQDLRPPGEQHGCLASLIRSIFSPGAARQQPRERAPGGLVEYALPILMVSVVVLIVLGYWGLNYGQRLVSPVPTEVEKAPSEPDESPIPSVTRTSQPPALTQTAAIAAVPSETPRPDPTATGVMTALPSETATSQPSRTPVPTPTITPPVAAIDDWEMALASFAVETRPGGCGARTLSIHVNWEEPPEELQIGPANLTITRAGSGSLAHQGFLDLAGKPLDIELPVASLKETFLVQVDHPALTFNSVILQYLPDCSNNHIQIDYELPVLSRPLERTALTAGALGLNWYLVTWGPSPFDDAWIAVLVLQPQGGDRNYIYWAEEVVNDDPGQTLPGQALPGQPLPDNRLTVMGYGCEPAKVKVGVTSAGETIFRKLILAPYCHPEDKEE